MTKKRGHGEGTIHHDKKRGRWQAQLVLPTGKRKSLYGAKRIDVLNKLDRLKSEVAAGLHGRAEGEQTFRQFAETWLAQNTYRLRWNSVVTYRNIITNHLDIIGDVPLVKLSPAMIHAHYTRELGSISAKFLSSIHKFFHALLEHAVELEILIKNPVKKGLAPTVPERDYETLTEEQVAALLTGIQDHRFEAIIVLAFATALRISEILGLRWEELDRDSATVELTRKLLNKGHGQFVLEAPKTKVTKRTILLAPYVLTALERRCAQQEKDRSLAGRAWTNDQGLIFTTEIGTPIPSNRVLRQFRTMLKAIGASPTIRLHDLRHTTATLLIERGMPMNLVSEWLGHGSVMITMNLYAHVTPKLRTSALETITALLPSPAR